MNLDQLALQYNLSVRAMNVCMTAKLIDLKSIVEWYQLYGTFRNIRNCGNLTNKELLNLARNSIEISRGLKTSIWNQNIEKDVNSTGVPLLPILLDELKRVYKLTNRAYNVCNNNSLSTRKDIVDWYENEGDFNKLRNVGYKTNKELIKLAKSLILENNSQEAEFKHDDFKNYKEINFVFNIYKQCVNNPIANSEKDGIKIYNYADEKLVKIPLESLTNLKKSILQYYLIVKSLRIEGPGCYSLNFPLLTGYFEQYKYDLIEKEFYEILDSQRNRLKNIISDQLNGNVDCWNFFKWISINKDFNSIRNLGDLTLNQLINFIDQFVLETIKILLTPESKTISFLQSVTNKRTQGIKGDLKITESEIENKKIHFIKFIIDNKKNLFSSMELTVLELSKSELALKFKITKERARQINVRDESEIIKKIINVRKLFVEDVLSTEFGSKDFLYSKELMQKQTSKGDRRLAELILQNDLVPEFNGLKIKASILKHKPSHHILNSRFELNNSILINSRFNLKSISNELDPILEYVIRGKQSIKKISISREHEFIIEIMKLIIKDQVGVIKIGEDHYAFKYRNEAYCQLALLFHKHPVHLDKIYLFITQAPEINEKPEKNSIRSSLINNKKTFFSIGKTSTYGLVSFNTKLEYATNSIKEEARLILDESKKPLHFSQIFSRLLARRKDLDPKSLNNILRMEKNIFYTAQNFFFLHTWKDDFKTPLNHKTVNAQFNHLIEKYELTSFWLNRQIVFSALESKCIPKYQIDYLMEQSLLEFKGKVTLQLKKNIKPLLEIIESSERMKYFLSTKYSNLNLSGKITFKKKLTDQLQVQYNQAISKTMINKVIAFYI